MVRKKTLSELEQAEIKLQTLIERRDALNQKAQLARQERDMVHEKKRELSAQLRSLKEMRARYAGEARAHRAKRDELQAQAKSLIEIRRKMRGKVGSNVAAELKNLQRQIRDMELRQQTASLSLSEENELIEELKACLKRAKELESLKQEQDAVMKEIRDIDAAITDLFQQAEKEHEASVELSRKAQEVHAQATELVRVVAALAAEGDEKHKAYLEARAKADEVHARVVEMREKVLSIKGARRAEIREARELLRAQNRAVRQALLDPKKLEQSAEEALQALLKKGRVEITR